MVIGNLTETEEGRLIKEETRTSMRLGTYLIAIFILFSMIAYFIEFKPALDTETLHNLYWIINFVVILLMITIFSLKKSIYFSSRLIKDEYTLKQVLTKWRHFDISLMILGSILPVLALIENILGVTFIQTWHLYLAAVLLTIMLMPMGIKVRSKLEILRRTHPDI